MHPLSHSGKQIVRSVFGLFIALVLPEQSTYAQSQAVQFDRLTRADGLASNDIISIVQDTVGFLWFSSPQGLTRYDGYDFTYYWHDPEDSTSISSDYTEDLYVDGSGTLWVGTQGGELGGLNRYEPITDSFTRFLPDPNDETSISHHLIKRIFEDRQGVLWIGTRAGGLNRFDRETETFTHFRHDPDDPTSLSGDNILSIYEDRQGTFWIGTRNSGLNRFDRETGHFHHYRHDPADENSLIDDGVYALHEDRHGTFWVGTGGGDGLHIMDREKGTFTRLRYDPDHPERLSQPYLRTGVIDGLDMGLRTILEDRRGILWMGDSKQGLNRYDPTTGMVSHYEHAANNPFSLGSNEIWNLYEDHAGTIWVAQLSSGGVSKVEPILFTQYEDLRSAEASNVYSIYEDRQGRVWLGTQAGLRQLDRATGSFIEPDGFAPITAPVHALLEDGRGGLWVGTADGPVVLDLEHRTVVRYRHDPSDSTTVSPGSVQALHVDAQERIWVSTDQGGLCRFDPITGIFSHHRTPWSGDPVYDYVRAISEDRSGNLWIIGRKGGSSYDPETGVRRTEFSIRANGEPNAIHEDRAGRFWVIHSLTGLWQLAPDTGTIRPYRTRNGNVAGTGMGILEDETGLLWISNKDGLTRFDPESDAVTHFTVADGLTEGEFNVQSFHHGQSGTFYFGSSSGLTTFDPNQFLQHPQPPKVAFTSFTLSNQPVSFGEGSPLKQPVSLTRSLTLRHDQNDIGLAFAAFDFRRPGQNRYRFILEGYETDWRGPVSDHTVSYTNLDPGSYTFRVTASNSDGIWNEEGTRLTITILPPWWRTTWAYLFYSLVFIAGVVAINRIQRRRLIAHERERARELELEQSRQIEKAHTELQQTHRELRQAHEHLKKTQDQLIQSEKMASLGQLTAGIAHEIKNPLNFVNNFAELMGELVDELNDELHSDPGDSGAGNPHQLSEILSDLKLNAEQIAKHGRRADGIVSAMMQHASGGTGKREPTDVNALLEEYVNLSFHGRRAQVEGFNCKIERDYDETVGPVEMVPEEMGRVFLNLLGNAFDAVSSGNPQWEDYEEPVIRVSTRRREDVVEITVADNGPGIPKDVQDKIFEPFFTTKPTAQGNTGLGLSLSYDSITLGHGGTLAVESEEGKGATFIVTLPLGHMKTD